MVGNFIMNLIGHAAAATNKVTLAAPVVDTGMPMVSVVCIVLLVGIAMYGLGVWHAPSVRAMIAKWLTEKKEG